MRRLLLNLIVLLIFCNAHAQHWSVYGGAGANYDGFLRDKSITAYKTKWPFSVGGAILAGGGFKATNGFDVFAEASLGYMNVKMPVPDVKSSDINLGFVVTKLMIGSGPRIETGNSGDAFRPYIQLGGAYLNNNSYRSSSNSDEFRLVTLPSPGQRSWVILFGGGLDYQFGAKTPSSINLSFSYSPLNILKTPYQYTVETSNGTYDINLQGKLLQVMLSYRIHLNLGSAMLGNYAVK